MFITTISFRSQKEHRVNEVIIAEKLTTKSMLEMRKVLWNGSVRMVVLSFNLLQWFTHWVSHFSPQETYDSNRLWITVSPREATASQVGSLLRWNFLSGWMTYVPNDNTVFQNNVKFFSFSTLFHQPCKSQQMLYYFLWAALLFVKKDKKTIQIFYKSFIMKSKGFSLSLVTSNL